MPKIAQLINYRSLFKYTLPNMYRLKRAGWSLARPFTRLGVLIIQAVWITQWIQGTKGFLTISDQFTIRSWMPTISNWIRILLTEKIYGEGRVLPVVKTNWFKIRSMENHLTTSKYDVVCTVAENGSLVASCWILI